jgi:hypothetical protein
MIIFSYSEKTLNINGRLVMFEFPIKEAFEIDDRLIVFLDPDSNLKRKVQFNNVIGFDAAGNQVWIADLPTPDPVDVYYKLVAENPLKLYSFCSFGECLVDPKTGKILSKPYYK